MTSVPELIGAD